MPAIDVAHRAVAPVAMVGVVERLAVAFGAAGIAVEDAHAVRGEDWNSHIGDQP